MLGVTCCPWQPMWAFSIPLEPECAKEFVGFFHTTMSTNFKSISQRGLKGGGFGKSNSHALQMSPFSPWDKKRGKQAAGRTGWDADMLVCLNRTLVLQRHNVRIVPNGVLITDECIPPACILWMAIWRDRQWRCVYHAKAQGLVITGLKDADPSMETDPGLLDSRAAYQDDIVARA